MENAALDREALLPKQPQQAEHESYNYGATSGLEQAQHDGNNDAATARERRSTEMLLNEPLAKFNPTCCFKKCCWEGQHSGQATISNEILNLVKNIVGSGGLSLPAGVAAFGNAPSAMVPSILLILFMAVLNAYSFSLIGRLCSILDAHSYKQAWDRSVMKCSKTGGRTIVDSSTIVAWVVVGKTFLGTWAASIIVASTCQPLLQMVGWKTATRSEALILVTLTILTPLCMKQTLQSLALFSLIGQFGTAWTILTMLIRFLDGTYRPGGLYYTDVDPIYTPQFGTFGAAAFFESFQSLILVSILSTGYVAHYNAPKFYSELEDYTNGRFNIVANVSFGLAALTYACVSSLGFWTFGEHSAPFILDNYSVHDPLAAVSRFGIALSVIFSYPLLFLGGRDGLLDLVGLQDRTVPKIRLVSALMLLGITTAAIQLSDLTFVLSFGGATMSSALIYIFPPLMFRAVVTRCACHQTASECFELKVAMAMLWVGFVLGIGGAVVSVVRAFF